MLHSPSICWSLPKTPHLVLLSTAALNLQHQNAPKWTYFITWISHTHKPLRQVLKHNVYNHKYIGTFTNICKIEVHKFSITHNLSDQVQTDLEQYNSGCYYTWHQSTFEVTSLSIASRIPKGDDWSCMLAINMQLKPSQLFDLSTNSCLIV